MVKPKSYSSIHLRTHHLEERQHSTLPHLFILAKEARRHENIPILQKCIGNKLEIK